MNCYNLNDNIPKFNYPITCCIGSFDGVHLGHQALIEETLKYDNSAVISIINTPKSKTCLTKEEDKISLFESMGVTNYIQIDYNMVSFFTPLAFIDLLKQMNVAKIIVGKDFCFGVNRSGDINTLSAHFEVIIIPEVMIQGISVRTNEIRKLLSSGQVKEAYAFLGRYYTVKGLVMHGLGLGKKLGFPTANIDYADYYLPKKGVYAGFISLGNTYYPAIIYVGAKPTFNGGSDIVLEAHILTYVGDLYDQELKCTFLEFIRDDHKFAGSDDLVKQINKDIDKAKIIIENSYILEL